MNTDEWIELESWPPPDLQLTTHHLRGDGSLTRDAPTMPSGTRGTTFTYNPADPTPTVGGPLLAKPGMQLDQKATEARSDLALFTSAPLESDLDIVGSPTARIFLRPELAHTDVFVRVCDVDERGISLNIVDAIRRLGPRTMDWDDVAEVGDGVLRVDLELFPTAYRVRRGHRLRVQVAAAAFPRFARNHGTGEHFAAATSIRTNRIEILHDIEHPSQVTIPTRQPHEST